MKKGMVFALVLLLVVSGLFAGGAKETSGPVVLKVGGIQTTEDPSTQALYKMAEIVEEKSGGRLKMDIYPASQLGSANAQVEAVSMGAQDMFVDAGWLGTYIPSKTIDAMWFIFEDADHYANYINSDVNKAMEEKFRQMLNIRIIASNWYRAPRSFATKTPINSLADFDGMVIRIPELAGYVESVAALGGKSTQVAWGETYLALQQGVVDAAEGPIDNLYSMHFYEAAPNITISNHLRDSMQVMINDAKFNSLDEDLQQILVDAALEAGDWYSTQIQEVINQSVEAMIEGGANVKEMPPEVLDQMRDIMTERIKALDAEGKYWETGLYARIEALK